MKYLSPSGYSPLEDESVELKTVTGECQQDEEEEFNDQLQSPEVSVVTSESSLQIFLEMLFPFIFGTLTLISYGMILTYIYSWNWYGFSRFII